MGRGADRAFALLAGTSGWALLALFLVTLAILVRGAIPAATAFGPGFVWDASWNVPELDLGAGAYIYGTLISSSIALALAVPVGVGTAIALVLLLPRRVAAVLGTFVELLAAIPSIVFGVWGLAVLAPLVAQWSGGRTVGPSLLTGGLVLAAMILPIVTAVSRDVLASVPLHQREGALALGATRWEVAWRVVLPHGRSGLFAASMLGLGRALGETMAVIMVIGNVAQVSPDLFASGATLASVIANEFGDPSGPIHAASLVGLGLILLLLSLIVSLAARRLARAGVSK